MIYQPQLAPPPPKLPQLNPPELDELEDEEDQKEEDEDPEETMFPTCVGMNRNFIRSPSGVKNVPHMRGD